MAHVFRASRVIVRCCNGSPRKIYLFTEYYRSLIGCAPPFLTCVCLCVCIAISSLTVPSTLKLYNGLYSSESHLCLMPHQSLDFEKIKIKSERRDKIRKDEFFRFIVLTANSSSSWKRRYPPTHTPEQKLSPADWWPWGWRRPAGWWSGRACSSLPVAGESSPHHFQLKRVTIPTIKSFSPITNAINERKDGRGTLFFSLLKRV